jgi:hypothetical protein
MAETDEFAVSSGGSVCDHGRQQPLGRLGGNGDIQDGVHEGRARYPQQPDDGTTSTDFGQSLADFANAMWLVRDPKARAFINDATLPPMLGANLETGPGITLADGRVIWFGASGHTCIYTPGAEGHDGAWVQGPDLPRMPGGDQLVAADAPAILEANGTITLAAWGPHTPILFLAYEPDGEVFAIIGDAERDEQKNGHAAT